MLAAPRALPRRRRGGQYASGVSEIILDVAGDLVDDSFVRKALAAAGGLAAFGLPEGWTRSEAIEA